jgi:ketosteroid isomerase-like protein
MSTSTDALKRGYDAFNGGDAEALADLYTDGVRWEGPNTSGVPMSGVTEGKEAVLSHIEGKTKSGNEIKLPGVELWRMTDGKVERAQTLVDTAEMKQGLEG